MMFVLITRACGSGRWKDHELIKTKLTRVFKKFTTVSPLSYISDHVL
jgi:hypothetical protein